MRSTWAVTAAGCSPRALSEAFRRFRDTTPLAALHTVRLDRVRDELRRDDMEASTAEVARRHGETPSETRRRHAP